MTFLLLPLAIFTITALFVGARTKSLSPRERSIIWISLLAHFVSVYAIIWVTKVYYGYGDMLGYYSHGTLIAAHLRTDFADVAPRVLELLFQQGGEELVPHGAGRSTGSMFAFGGILAFLLGDSLAGICALVSALAFSAKLSIYRVLRRYLQASDHRPVLLGTMLIPSFVFWSSGLLKEAMAIIFLGLMMRGADLLARSKTSPLGATLLGVGIVGTGLVKAYILIPFALGAGVFLYVRSSPGRKGLFARPSRLILASALVVVLLASIGSLFPRYDVTEIQDQFEKEQQAGQSVDGGSNFQLSGDTGSSPTGLIIMAPVAIGTALLRPAIIEARNPLALVNGLETLVFTILLVQALRRRKLRNTLDQIRESPLLAFCAVFTLALAFGVGFSTTNMGTLSRYRMPLLPFFATFVVALRSLPPSVKGRGKLVNN